MLVLPARPYLNPAWPCQEGVAHVADEDDARPAGEGLQQSKEGFQASQDALSA